MKFKKNNSSKIKLGIVVTSIFNNNWLGRIFNRLAEENILEDAKIYFISDNKTPTPVYLNAKELEKKGLNIEIPDLDNQNIFLSSIGAKNFILENSDHRRNVGFLLAIRDKVEVLLSMDDDNFPLSNNFFKTHLRKLCIPNSQIQTSAKEKTFNNCRILCNKTFLHPRGFPFNQRHFDAPIKETKSITEKLDINAGLWTISPDVDAVSWLIANKKIGNRHTKNTRVKNYILNEGSYCPINSQNTSLVYSLIPAYYFIRMGYDLGGGLKFDRLGDIYSGYFLQKTAKHLGLNIGFGMPLATHERNSHNYLKDANGEWGCMRTIDDFFTWLVNAKLEGESVCNVYENLADSLHEFASNSNFLYMKEATRGFYHEMAYDMKKWIKLVKILS